MGFALGTGPPGMAHRVLGDGRGPAGGGLRDPRRRQRPDLPAPRERGRADAAPRTGQPLARLWVHNGMVRLETEKMAKSVGNIFLLHEALAAYGRDALMMYFCGGHYRQPIEFDAERLEEARARVARIREAAQAAPRRALAGLVASRCASVSSRRWQTTSTRPRRWRPCSTGCGRQTAPQARWGTRPARDARRAGARERCSRPGPRRRRRCVSCAAARERARQAAGLRRGRPPAGARSRHWAGRSVTVRRVRSCCRERDRLRPQPGARGAARPPRGEADLGHEERGPRTVAGGASVALEPAPAEEIERRCGSPAHQGMCAEAGHSLREQPIRCFQQSRR